MTHPVETIIDGRAVFRVREDAGMCGDTIIACPICKQTRDMAASPFGHPHVLVCDNPPCIYLRALDRVVRPVLRVVG